MASVGSVTVDVKTGKATQVVLAARRARARLLEATSEPSPIKRGKAVRSALGELDRALASWEARGKTLRALEPMSLEEKAAAFRDAAAHLRGQASRHVSDQRALELAKTFDLWAEVLEHDETDPRAPHLGAAALGKTLRALPGLLFGVIGLAAAALFLRILWEALAFGWGLLG